MENLHCRVHGDYQTDCCPKCQRAHRVDEIGEDNVQEEESIAALESKFTEIAAMLLDEQQAKNYVEIQLVAGNGKEYIMTLQRKEGETPHQLRRKAEELYAQVKKQCDDALALSNAHRVRSEIWFLNFLDRLEIALGHSPYAEICEWCNEPVANGETHGELKCFKFLDEQSDF